MKNPKSLLLLIMMAALTALSSDLYLPSFPSLAEALNTDASHVQLTMSMYFLSFALGQLIYGPLSDRYGRRKPLIVGLLLYFAADLLCAWAGSIEVLILGRFLQGLGACSGVVSCLAIVRDLYEGRAATRAMAKIASVCALAPILAPMLGGFLETHFGWRASFFFMAFFGALLLFLVIRSLPESAPLHEGGPQPLLKSYLGVAHNPVWRANTVINSFAFAGLLAYIGTSSDLMIRAMGLSAQEFGFVFGANAMVFMLGSHITGKLTSRLDTPALARMGTVIYLLGGLLMMLTTNLPISPILALMGSMAVVTLGVSFVLPASMAGAIMPFAHSAGAASALLGFSRFGLGSLVLVLLGRFEAVTALPLGITIGLCGAVCTLVAFRYLESQSSRGETRETRSGVAEASVI